jgi:hypothetical protein
LIPNLPLGVINGQVFPPFQNSWEFRNEKPGEREFSTYMSFTPPTLPSDYAAYLSTFNSEKFKSLWPAQAHVLGRYDQHVTQADLGVELPTGAGKTLITLLIAEAWRSTGAKVAVALGEQDTCSTDARGSSKPQSPCLWVIKTPAASAINSFDLPASD